MPELAPRALILSVYGLYAREEHNWLSVASLVRLLGDLGVDAAGVRSSISRLKRRGTLQAMRLGGAAGYALSAQSLAMLREGDVRIFHRQRATEEDGLVLVVYSIPEPEREKRHQLRTTLTRMGFGSASPGVWVAPATLRSEISRTLERLDLTAYVDLFHAHYDGFGALRDRVHEWWDLGSINDDYGTFVERYGDAHVRWKSAGGGARAAFEIYLPMLTTWRRLPYRDPGLPVALLPDDWTGLRAAELFGDLDALLRSGAREHALATIHG